MATISKRTRHAVYDTHIHLVFVTKYRRKVLTDAMLSFCEQEMSRVAESLGSELEEFNGEADHVHMLVSLPPTLSIATLVNSLKGVSSRLLQRDYEKKLNLRDGKLWSRSYYAGSAGGAPLATLKSYIANQDRPKPADADFSPA